MTTIIKSGIMNIMRVFYNDKFSAYHLRELARRTKLQSITRQLKTLETEKILSSKKQGNQKLYAIKPRAFPIFTLLDTERFESLPAARKTAITVYLKTLPEKPIYAILFGSTAKENYTKESDIDILIITNRKINPSSAEKEADALTGMNISTFQIEYPNFVKELKLKEDKVVQSALNTGYPLINHIQFYEEIFNERI